MANTSRDTATPRDNSPSHRPTRNTGARYIPPHPPLLVPTHPPTFSRLQGKRRLKRCRWLIVKQNPKFSSFSVSVHVQHAICVLNNSSDGWPDASATCTHCGIFQCLLVFNDNAQCSIIHVDLWYNVFAKKKKNWKQLYLERDSLSKPKFHESSWKFINLSFKWTFDGFSFSWKKVLWNFMKLFIKLEWMIFARVMLLVGRIHVVRTVVYCLNMNLVIIMQYTTNDNNS
jgi:hypothetical protein